MLHAMCSSSKKETTSKLRFKQEEANQARWGALFGEAPLLYTPQNKSINHLSLRFTEQSLYPLSEKVRQFSRYQQVDGCAIGCATKKMIETYKNQYQIMMIMGFVPPLRPLRFRISHLSGPLTAAMARLMTSAPAGYQSFTVPETPKELNSEGCLGSKDHHGI